MLAFLTVSLCAVVWAQLSSNIPKKLLIVTVGTEETDGLKRLKRTVNAHHMELNVFGLGERWNGGDTRIEQGGGQKIRILRKALESYKDRNDLIILFVDGYDVVFLGNEEQILRKFFTFFEGFRIVFSAEPFCWPDRTLAPTYPLVNFGYRYLNSGVFIGFAPEIWKLISYEGVEDNDDDQLYYTRLYLDKSVRDSLKITLDSMGILFQNLNGASDDVKLEMNDQGKETYSVYNTIYNTYPLVVHGNGPSKLQLNRIANYIDPLRTASLRSKSAAIDGLPKLYLSIIISKPIPFIREFFEQLENLIYVDAQIDLYVYCNQEFMEKEVNSFVEKSKHRYNSVLYDDSAVDFGEREARAYSLKQSLEAGSDYLVMIDGDVHLNNSDALLLLINLAQENDIEILAPLVGQQNSLYTNFWGALAENGYYARSEDYIEITNRKKVGVWNVPYISSILIISKDKLIRMLDAYSYNNDLDPDMSFCSFARDEGHFLYVDNRFYYGFLVISEDMELTKLHPEMYEIFNNRILWEKRYIHPNYFASLNGSTPIPQLCQDVYDFPLMSETFCKELIEECEHYGQWSDGKNQDARLAGGYENVPTRDIHMKQIDFERHWLYMLNEYVRPIQEKLFVGYYKEPVESVMMFVVRYKPEEQAYLRPHHDASTYSIDVALNKRGVDYQGGGVRFLRYNCTFDADVVGHSMIFPGRLTHLHEGLETTQGTRYIAVSFINP